MARDDACFGVPDLRRREQGLLTVNALEGVYHPRVLTSARMASWPGASDRLLSCVTVHSRDQEVNALTASRQRTERSRPSRAWLRRPPFTVSARCTSRSRLTIRHSCLCFSQKLSRRTPQAGR